MGKKKGKGTSETPREPAAVPAPYSPLHRKTWRGLVRAYGGLAVVITLASGLLAIVAIQPKVSVTPIASVAPQFPNLMSFTIRNDGVLDLTKISLRCYNLMTLVTEKYIPPGAKIKVETPNLSGFGDEANLRDIDTLPVGQSATRTCPAQASSPDTHIIAGSQSEIHLQFNAALVPIWTFLVRRRFVSAPQSQGFAWVPEPPVLSKYADDQRPGPLSMSTSPGNLTSAQLEQIMKAAFEPWRARH